MLFPLQDAQRRGCRSFLSRSANAANQKKSKIRGCLILDYSEDKNLAKGVVASIRFDVEQLRL